MKALVYKGPEKICLEKIEEPLPNHDEATIEVTAVGICGSDVEGYLGKTGRRNAPLIMGHEFAGRIIRKASNSNSNLKVGKKVVVFPKLYCGECEHCKKGEQNLCENADLFGVLSKNGAMTERMAIKEKYLIPVNNDLDDVELSLTEPLAVAYHAAVKIKSMEILKEDNVLIVGAGTIGLFILQVLRALGYQKIYIMDMFDTRLNIAQKLGALPINPKNIDVKKYIEDSTDGKMINCSFEAVGKGVTAASSLEVLQLGGKAIWVGNAQKIIEINMQTIVTREIKINGSYLYTLDDFIESISLISKGLVNCNALISKVISLDEGAAYFEKLSHNYEGKLLKVVIDPRK
jgi:2-desacetyl-2-hydroxyethyl bacteriochlorophyllide A dehydrogenase